MKTLDLEEARNNLDHYVDAAQGESILITRHGKPAAIILGLADYDEEDLQWASDADFWKLIAERRRQPTMSRTELDSYLASKDSSAGEGAARSAPAAAED